jgi:hypothetical protein
MLARSPLDTPALYPSGVPAIKRWCFAAELLLGHDP